jgi:hypothetical protein
MVTMPTLGRSERSLGKHVPHRTNTYLTDILDKPLLADSCYFSFGTGDRVAKSGYGDVSPPRAHDERVPFAAPVRLVGLVCQLATKRV